MVAITDLAAEAITSLTTDARLPDGGGLRIAAPDPDGGLEPALAEQPSDDDVVVSGSGVAVFLEPGAAQVLDDQVLDVEPVAAPGGGRELRFAIAPRPA